MSDRPKHSTGIEVTDEVYEKIQRALEPSVEPNFNTGITITRPGDPRKALDILKEYALSKGLPELLPTFNYCLDGREIVCLVEALPATA